MLEIAMKKTDQFKSNIDWIVAPAHKTSLPDHSVSIVTAFNSIHHMPVKETLDEVKRILMPNGFLAIYTRVLDQESEHIWGRWFPGYIGYSVIFTREFISTFSKYNKRWQLMQVQDFTFKRKVSLARICEQTRNKYYSTLARYPEEEFELAYLKFLENIIINYPDINEIEYPSSYSLFIYRYV